jgi:hypothetical protein
MRGAIGRGRAAVAVLLSGGAFLGAPPPADVAAAPASFYTVVPCRVFDSRQPAQAPALGSGTERVVLVEGMCSIPPEASAVAFTVLVTQPTALGHLRAHAAGGPPGLPVINFPAGATRSSNGIVRLSAAGEIALLPQLASPGTVHVVVDVTGYFVDDVPPTAVDDAAALDEDSTATAVDVLANDTDPDGGPISVGSVTQPDHGTVAIAGGGTQVTYAPAPDYCNTPPGTALDTFSYTLSPGSSSATVTVTVACVNDAPVLAGAGTVAFSEGGGPVAAAPALTVSDVDDATLVSAAVTITNLLDPGLETLAATTAGTSITALFVAPTLTLSGTDTVANYESVLRGVTYHDASSNPDPTARVVAFVVSDGTLASVPQAATVTITVVNDAPVVTAGGGSPTFVEGGAAVALDPALTVTDADDDALVSATVTITNLLDPGAETLAASTAGTAIVAAYAAPTLSLSGADTLANYEAVLRSVTYANSSEDPAPTSRAIAFVANDGDAASAPATTTVGVTAVNDAPVLVSGGGSPTFTEDGPAVAVDPSLTVTDVDDATLASAMVTITNLLDAGSETLAASTGGTAITAAYVAPTLTLSGTDSLASYQAVLRSVTYASTSQNPTATPRSIQFRANDGSDPGNTVTTVVGVVAVNDPPVLGGAGAVTFTEGDGPLAVAPALTVSDVDHASLPSATVTITNLADAGAELLLADTTGTSIAAVYAAPTLTLTGVDTVAAYQAVLRSVAYRNTSESPTPTTRTVAFVASDGTATGGAVASVAVVSVNDPPALGTNPVAYATAGNTQLHVAGDTLPGVAAVADAQGVLAKAGVVDVDGPAPPSVVAASGTTANGGQFTIDADGSFTYVPAAGFTGTDSFTYGATDTVDTITGTVNVTVGTVVWYVRDVVDAQNPAGGDGRSTDALESLAAAQAASGEGHVLFVFAGDTGTTPHAGGVVLKSGQKLLGEGVGLSVPPFGTLVPAGNRPHLTNAGGDAVTVPATAGPRSDVEIRGLDLVAGGNAIDVTATGANPVSVTITANTMQAGQEGIDLNAGATGGATFTALVQANAIVAGANGFDARTGAGAALRVDFSGNSVLANGSGVVVDGAAGGSVVVTGFGGNAVSASTAGDGILVRTAVFDAVPGGSIDPVAAGVTTIGASGNGVGGSGLLLLNVAGAIDFTDLDVYADAGAALLLSGTGSFTGAGGTQVTVADGVATLEATGGPAVDATAATLRLVAAGLATTNSATTGLSLVNVSDGPVVQARLSAPAGSFVSGAVGTAFNVSGGNAGLSFAGPITNTAGRSVSITGWAGDDATDDIELAGAIDDGGTGIVVSGNGGPRTITFGGTLTVHPVSGSAGFTATSNTQAGGLRITGTGNTIDTSNAAALTVTGTTIGAGGLAFQRVSASGGTNGVVLANTGSLGGLRVTGAGAAGSGGTVQNMTADGVSLVNTREISLTHMVIHNNDGSGISGDDVTNFTIEGSTVSDNADTATGTEAGLRFQELLGDCAITNTVVSGSFEDNVRITPASGALTSLVISGSTIGPNSPTSGGNGVALIGSVSAAASVTVTGTLFQGNRGAGFLSNYGGTGGHTVVVTGNVFRDNGRAVSLAANGTAGLTFGVSDNLEIVRSAGNAVELLSSSDTAAATQLVGSVHGNVIGNANPDSGSRDAYGIAIDLRGDERAIVAATGNAVRHTDLTGLFVTDTDFGTNPGPPGDSDVTVRDNTVSGIDDNSGFPCGSPWGTLVDLRHTTLGCLDLFSNTSAESPESCPDTAHFRVRQRNTSTVLFERLSDGDATPSELIADPAVVQAHVVTENDPGTTANVLLATGFTEAASGACVKP